MAQLKAIQNHIIFQFVDGSKAHAQMSHFAEQTDWGFEFADRETSLEQARWGIVIAVGKDVPEDIKPGMEVCIDKLKWTNAFEFEGQDYWRTDADQILLVNETTDRVSKDYIEQDTDNSLIQGTLSRAWS